MTKNQLINLIINSPTINTTLDKVQPEDLRLDFKQHFYLQLLEKTEEKLLYEYEKGPDCLIKFAAAILKLQLKSNTSSFHKLYRKKQALNDYYAHFDTISEIELGSSPETLKKINYDNIILALNHIHPKKAKLFIEHYINQKTLKQISQQYKIKYSTVVYNIRSTENQLKRDLKFELE